MKRCRMKRNPTTGPPDDPDMKTIQGIQLGLVVATLAAGCATAPHRWQPRALALQAAGIDALGRGELDRAAGHFSLALEYEPRLAEAENGLGLVALRRGDWARAEERFRAALALNEDLAEAHLNIAGLLMRRDADADALPQVRAALAIDPGYADARLLSGELLLRLGRPNDAHWELEKLCAAFPGRADAHAANALVLAYEELTEDQPATLAAALSFVQGRAAIDQFQHILHREPVEPRHEIDLP